MYESKLKNPQADLLVRALLSLSNEEGAYRLLDDLCTIHEVQSLSQRLEVACLLREGITYQEIAQRTGASTATISRVNRCLHYGSDGYRQVLEKIAAQQDGTKGRA